MKKIFILLAWSLFTTGIFAQKIIGDLRPGDPDQKHILETNTGDRLAGQVLQMTDSTLHFRYKGIELTFDRADIKQIEVAGAETTSPALPFEVIGPLRIDDPDQKHRIILRSGDIFSGKITSMDDQNLHININGNIINIETARILLVEVQGYTPPEPEIEISSAIYDPEKTYILTTRRGDRFVGHVVNYDSSQVVFKLKENVVLHFPLTDIKTIFPAYTTSYEGKIYRPKLIRMSGAQNLFLSPTAFNYKEKEWELRSTQILYLTADNGVSENLSVGFGLIPLLVANVVDFHLKYTYDIGEYVHFGLGGHLAAGFIVVDPSGDNWATAILHTSVSIGTESRFVNVGYARWIPLDVNEITFPSNIYMVGGSFRIAPKWRLFTDILRVVEQDKRSDFSTDAFVWAGFGAGWFNYRSRLDFGIMIVPREESDFGSGIGVPILTYARRF